MEETPFEDRHVPRTEIDWERSAWWWRPLTHSVHPAMKMTTLVVSLFAVLLAKLGIACALWLFAPRTQDGSSLLPSGLMQMETPNPTIPFASPIIYWLSQLIEAWLSLSVGYRELAFLTFCLIWLTLVLALLGGVLARRAMVDLGQRTVAPWGESFKLVAGRWQSLLWVTGMHLVGLAALLTPFVLLGLIARGGSVLANIAGVLLLIAFPLVFAVGRMLLSMVLCFPLAVCAIAAEKKADAFEGFSRSNAYLFQRPVVTVICVLLLALIGLVGEQLVWWTLYGGWSLIRNTFMAFGGGSQTTSESYVGFGTALTRELIVSYWFSFFWASSGAVYLVLRKSVDNTELDELDSLENLVEIALPDIPKVPPGSELPPTEPSVEPQVVSQ